MTMNTAVNGSRCRHTLLVNTVRVGSNLRPDLPYCGQRLPLALETILLCSTWRIKKSMSFLPVLTSFSPPHSRVLLMFLLFVQNLMISQVKRQFSQRGPGTNRISVTWEFVGKINTDLRSQHPRMWSLGHLCFNSPPRDSDSL